MTETTISLDEQIAALREIVEFLDRAPMVCDTRWIHLARNFREVDALRTLLATVEAQQWKPIHEHPRDHQPCWLHEPGQIEWPGYYSATGGWFFYTAHGNPMPAKPTHYARGPGPLPPAPEGGE